MANATADYGFAYVKSHSGEPKAIGCAVLTAGTDLYVGDPVILSGTGDSSGRPSITRAAAQTTTVNVFGVVQGFKATGTDNLSKQYSDSADTVIVLPTTPGSIWRVNSDSASLDDIGLRFDHIVAAGSSLTGRSGYYLDVNTTTAGSATSNCWMLVGFDRRPDNEFSTTVSTDTDDVDCLVMCVESVWLTGGGA